MNVFNVDDLVRQGRLADAFSALTQAASAGNTAAALTLANWRMSGALIRRDLEAARDLFAQAARFGSKEAEPALLALLANGAGGTAERHWGQALTRLRQRQEEDPAARQQCELLNGMALDEHGLPTTRFEGDLLRADPEIRFFAGFFTPQECAYLSDLAQPLLQPSVVIDPRSGAFVENPIRTSTAAAFPFVMETPVLNALNNRIAAATNTNYRQGEPLQVLSYAPGQQYRLHSDAIPAGNQRIVTLLVYLNEGYEGGETEFPQLQLTVRGRVGDALMFRNVDKTGRPHPQAVHAGKPVLAGCKRLASKWIREQPLNLAGPPGRPF